MRLFVAFSSQALKIFEDGDSTTSLAAFDHSFFLFDGFFFPSHTWWEFPWLQLVTTDVCLLASRLWEKTVSVLFVTSFHEAKDYHQSSPSYSDVASSAWINSVSPACLECLTPLSLWPSTGLGLAYHCLSLWNPKLDVTHYDKCGLTNTNWKGITIFLQLLAVLLLIQPSMWLAFFTSRAHCWIVFKNPRSCPTELLSL